MRIARYPVQRNEADGWNPCEQKGSSPEQAARLGEIIRYMAIHGESPATGPLGETG